MIGNSYAVRNEGLKILNNGLGAADTVVFLRQFENGRGNYTEERNSKFDNSPEKYTIDAIAERIFRQNKNNA